MPPMNGSGIRKPNSARLGIVCITFAIPSTGPRRDLRRVIRIPSGNAIKIAIAVERKTSHACCAMCARMSDQLALRNSSMELSADYADDEVIYEALIEVKGFFEHSLPLTPKRLLCSVDQLFAL